MAQTFRQQCVKAAEATGIEVVFFDDGIKDVDDVFVDDGSLHIRRAGFRACFHVAVNDDGRLQNLNTRDILKRLKIRLTKQVLSRAFVSERGENEDEDDRCPHCGGQL